MSDDSALFDEPDETETDIAAGQRAVQIEGAANKKRLGDIEDAKFEEVKPTAPTPATTQQPKVTNDAPLPY